MSELEHHDLEQQQHDGRTSAVIEGEKRETDSQATYIPSRALPVARARSSFSASQASMFSKEKKS